MNLNHDSCQVLKPKPDEHLLPKPKIKETANLADQLGVDPTKDGGDLAASEVARQLPNGFHVVEGPRPPG